MLLQLERKLTVDKAQTYKAEVDNSVPDMPSEAALKLAVEHAHQRYGLPPPRAHEPNDDELLGPDSEGKIITGNRNYARRTALSVP